MAKIIIREPVITSSVVAKITYVSAEVFFKMVVDTFLVAKITFVVNEKTIKVAVIVFFSDQYHFCSGCDNI